MPRVAAWSLLIASLAAFAIGLAWTMLDSAGIYVAFGGAASFMVTLPAVILKDYDLISPWSLVILAIYIATTKSFFIAIGRDGSRTISELFLLGHPPEFFIRPGIAYLTGVAMLTLGYLVAHRRNPQKSVVATIATLRFGRGFEVMVVVFALIGFVAFVAYAQNTGGLSPSRLSAKRTTINGIDLEIGYQSFGHLRVLNYFASIAFWAQLAKYAHDRVVHHPLTLRGLFLIALLANACLLPLYTSARRDIFYLVIVGAVISLCLTTTTRSLRRAIIAAIAFVLVVAPVLTSLRSQQVANPNQDRFEAILETFVYNRTFIDMNTSALIIDSVPDSLPYANGDTITSYLFAPIPRTLWPGKPVISPGTEIGLVIFGNDRSGVPPGLVAESFWNFGWAGLLLIPLILGWLLRHLHDRTAPFVRDSPIVTLVYSICIFRFGIMALTNSIGFSLFTFLEFFVLLSVFLLATARAPKAPKARVRAVNARPFGPPEPGH